MTKISLVGAGNIGGELASLISSKNLGDIVLIDVVSGLAKGKALDLSQSGSVRNFSHSISGGSALSLMKDSDVIVVTAGVSRKPGMSRDDLISTNLEIMRGVGSSIKKYSPKAFVICVTNPLDAMTWVLKKISGVKKNMIVGMAGTLDSARFKLFLSEKLNVSQNDIHTMVLGGHGDTMVPLMNYTTINAIPIIEFLKYRNISMKDIEKLVSRTRNGGGEIVALLKTGSAFYAPASSAIEMADSFLKDKKKLLPCAAYVDGHYDIDGLYVGVPVIIGKNGVERIVEISFTSDEKDMFDHSVSAVKQLNEVASKFEAS